MALTQQSPPLFLVGTRFQAVMVRSILKHLRIAAYDLVVYHQNGEMTPDDDFVFSILIRNARNVTRINRKQPTKRQFNMLLGATGKQSRTVFLAQINMPFILALFRLRPGTRLRTFDEGGYNIAPEGPFHAPPPRKWRRFRDIVAFALFPKGALNFVQRRTEKHYTPFPPQKNVLSVRAEQIAIPWANFVDPTEAGIAQNAQKIMVLPCMKDFTGSAESRKAILSIARDCNLVVRHPRDSALKGLASLCLRSPVEGIICAAAKQRPIQVMHYASTVRLTLAEAPNVNLIDISLIQPA